MIGKQFLCALVTVGFAVAVCGCDSLPKDPTDEDLIWETLSTWKTGIESADIDLMMTAISEDFVGPEGVEKAAFHLYMASLFHDSTLADAEMLMERMTLVIAHDKASAKNLGLRSRGAAAVIDFDLEKEDDGVWRIVSIQLY